MFFQRYGSLSAGQAILATLFFVSGPAVLRAQPIRSEFEAIDRIVAIGDVLEAFREARQHRPNDSEVAELIAELTSPS